METQVEVPVPDAPSDQSIPAPATFLYEERERVARITLNRPDRLNALTFEVYEELTATLRHTAMRNVKRRR